MESKIGVANTHKFIFGWRENFLMGISLMAKIVNISCQATWYLRQGHDDSWFCFCIVKGTFPAFCYAQPSIWYGPRLYIQWQIVTLDQSSEKSVNG
jgi:hypothetical protein